MKEAVAQEKPPWINGIRKKVMRRLYDAAFKVLSSRFERLINEIGPSYPENYASRIRQAHNSGYLLMTIANHVTQADGLPIAKISQDTEELINEDSLAPGSFHGFRITVAASVEGGKQSEYITSAFNRIAPLLNHFSLFPRLYIRRGTVDGDGFSYSALRDVSRARAEGYGVATVPEGTVKGGRTDENGEQYGLQEIGEQNLTMVIRMVDKPDRSGKQDRKVLYISEKFENMTLVYHPDKKHPSLRELVSLLRPKVLAKKLSVTVNEPISSDQLRRIAAENNVPDPDYPKFAARYIYGQIAEQLSPQAQGEYGRRALKYKQLADQRGLVPREGQHALFA